MQLMCCPCIAVANRGENPPAASDPMPPQQPLEPVPTGLHDSGAQDPMEASPLLQPQSVDEDRDVNIASA